MNGRKIEAFVIHLARATQRRAQVDRIIAASPLDTRVLDAVDGRAMSAAERAGVYRREMHEPRYPFEIGPGEIGCFLSHRKVWQAMIDDGLDAALVIEDDVEIDGPVFSGALECAMSNCTPTTYTQFQVRKVPGGGTVIASGNGIEIRRPVVVPLRTSAQLVGQEAASRLLAVSEQFDRPVDSLLQMSWVTGIAIDCVVPSGVSDRTAASGGSTIKGGKTLSDRIVREFRRFAYRRAIAHRAAQEAGQQ